MLLIHPFLSVLVALYLFQSILLRLSDGPSHFYGYFCVYSFGSVSAIDRFDALFCLITSKLGERERERTRELKSRVEIE